MIDLSKAGQCHQLSHWAQGKSFSLPVSADYKGTVKTLKEKPGDTAVTFKSCCTGRGHGMCSGSASRDDRDV